MMFMPLSYFLVYIAVYGVIWCFYVLQTADIPSVRYVCIFAAVVIFLDYVYQITFFAAFIVLTGRREAKGLHALTCKKTTPQSEAGMGNKCHINRISLTIYNPLPLQRVKIASLS